MSQLIFQESKTNILHIVPSHGAEVTYDDINRCRDRDKEAMLEVYLPTKENTRGYSSPLLTDPFSSPAPLKKLCRDVLRRTMRTITGGRTIHPLVASLESSGELDINSGNFLVCDLSGDWRKKMVIDTQLFLLFHLF